MVRYLRKIGCKEGHHGDPEGEGTDGCGSGGGVRFPIKEAEGSYEEVEGG